MLQPLTEHEDFDLVAYKDGVFKRIQVRYRCANNGTIAVEGSSSWADKNGNHRIPVTSKVGIDVFAVYCPDTNKCYYVPHQDMKSGGIKLRLVPTKNNQRARINFAEDYLDIPE